MAEVDTFCAMVVEFTGEADERQLQRVAQAVAEALARGDSARVHAHEQGWRSVQRVTQLVMAGPLPVEQCRISVRQRVYPQLEKWRVLGWHRDGGQVTFEPLAKLPLQDDDVVPDTVRVGEVPKGAGQG